MHHAQHGDGDRGQIERNHDDAGDRQSESGGDRASANRAVAEGVIRVLVQGHQQKPGAEQEGRQHRGGVRIRGRSSRYGHQTVAAVDSNSSSSPPPG